jgi:inner membrane protein
MPKIIAHALAGAAVVAAVHPNAGFKYWKPLFLGAVFAVAADADYFFDWIYRTDEIHRGFTHSILFSLLTAILLLFYFGAEKTQTVAAYSLSYLSHAALDFATSTSGGVKLFYPFYNKYYYLGLTDIFEMSVGSDWNQILKWVSIEISTFLPFLIIVLLLKYAFVKTRRNF